MTNEPQGEQFPDGADRSDPILTISVAAYLY
jgi:hypothetical protein